MDDLGKLLLMDGETGREFAINKPAILLGRATTNDIVITNSRASRSHARVDSTPAGLLLTDLDSANGVWVNGGRVQTAAIHPGDEIEIGGCRLRYLPPTPDEREDVTLINTFSELEQTIHELAVPVSLNDTSRSRLVISTPDRTWELPLEDSVNIGRAEGSQLVLDYPKISRSHARLERVGGGYVLRDLESTNGTYVRGAKIEQHGLQNGDTFQIGPVRIVFNAGFSSDELTLSDGLDTARRGVRAPVIFVPGTMGSQLWLGGQRVWPNVNLLFTDPQLLSYSENTQLTARDILNEMVIVPNLISFDQYNLMGDYLTEELGYTRSADFLEFAYDWRQDVRKSARELAQTVEAWGVDAPITLIAHSLGTLVSRYYVEKLGGRRRVGRLILIGGPHRGVPKIAANLLTGVDLLPFGLMGRKLTEVIETFPSCYQILPLYACASDQNGNPIHFMEDESWVKPAYRPLLHMAREFRRELGNTTSVPTLSIFGYGLKTAMQLHIQRDQEGVFHKASINVEPGGDSSVPESSAILPRTEIHPVRQFHGTLFNDNDVKMRLKLELTRRTDMDT